MIPAEAVEAAVEAHCEGTMLAALEAAYPIILAAALTVTDEMVDAILEHDGTPRRKLFEYPHRDDDSLDMIRAAEALVRKIIRLCGAA